MIASPGCRAIASLLFVLWLNGPAEARRYPITKSDASGTWVGTRAGLLHGTGELWKRYDEKKGLPHLRVNDLELSPRDVWVATPRGLARLNKGSRRWEVYGANSLPSRWVNAVSIDASDPDLLWVGTQKGLARFNVRTNRWHPFGHKSGLPSVVVHDVLVRGRTVWAATDAGLAAYDTKLKTWTIYRRKQGLVGDRVLEIDEQGADLWLTCDRGQSRMNLQRRTFSSFGKAQGLPSPVILAQARLQSLIYIVTQKGLITYDIAADSLAPFLFFKGLDKSTVRSVATAGGFVWFATDKGLMRFEPTKKTWEYYRVEDGLSSDDLREITVVGSYLMLFNNERGVDTYDYRKDEWVERPTLGSQSEAPSSLPTGEKGPSKGPKSGGDAGKPGPKKRGVQLAVSAELDTELKQDFAFPTIGPSSREGYWLVNTLRLGAGAQWASGRKVDLSGRLDWGDISPIFGGDSSSLRSFQSYDIELRYLGKSQDILQEAIVSDELRLEPDGGRLTERTELEGARAVIGFGARRRQGRFATLRVVTGLRRGTPTRVVFRRPTVGALEIMRFKLLKNKRDGSRVPLRNVIPSSVRALLDGKELDRNVDYFVDHDNGVLWIKNTDLINTMRVLEVEFEYEQIPQKNVGAVSMTDLLPKDGNIGQLKRSGRARWARDEQALFDEIDGGADQFISRGWEKSLSQDFEWASAGISLRIYDMDDEKNARSIYIARRLPDAKPVPGLPDCFVERQTASISVKCLKGKFYIEITIDQGTMEQEILAIAGWLVSKLAISGSTSADGLRDVITSAELDLRFGEGTRLGLSYFGLLSREDLTLQRQEGLLRRSQDLLSAHMLHTGKLSRRYQVDARLQAAATSSRLQALPGRQSGGAVLGRVVISGPALLLRASARKYTATYGGLGLARQTEFCRKADQRCDQPGDSRLDHEISIDSTFRAARWLPLQLVWQRQSSKLGEKEYAVAPGVPSRLGVRDVASAELTVDKGGLPKLSLGGAFIRRDDPLAAQRQWRASASFESDLSATLLKTLKFKKLYLRGLYELGKNAVDEHRKDAASEQDRDERMHHAVGELRLAPTLTENAYATLEYQSLRGALDADGRVADRLRYWRLDTGGGSSVIPGLALRFDGTFWFGDDQPLQGLVAGVTPKDDRRQQEANSRLSGVIDLFFGEWIKTLSPVRLNGAYTYTEQKTSQARRTAGVPWGKEVCDVAGDEDGDGLADCADPDCAMADLCMLRTSRIKAHRIFGTLSWNTPGKLQAEVFADLRFNKAGENDTLRSTRQELRSFITWRPVYPSPLTLRFDMLRETARPDPYDGIVPAVEPESATYEPALEWRQRWSARWWHLAKLNISYSRVRDLPHVRTVEDTFGRKGDLERLDYDEWSIRPSVEIRRRFEAEDGTWNFRPYVRASYKYRRGRGRQSRIVDTICRPGDGCLSDGSETSQLTTLSLGLVWVHGENVYVDLDLTAAYYDCRRAPSGSRCNDKLTFSPHLLATARF